MKVTLWLTVREKTITVGESKTWTKTITTGQAPDAGEDVTLWPYEDDPTDGITSRVSRRYWDAEGGIHCILRTLVIDPDGYTQGEIRREIRDRACTLAAWYTDSEHGRPEPGLERGGWRPYL